MEVRTMIRAIVAAAAAGAVFSGGAWGQCELQKFRGSDVDSDDYFGSVAAVCGDVAVVGAPKWKLKSGSAYVFRSDGGVWTEETKLVGDVYKEYFGTSVAINGDVVVVGAPQLDGYNPGPGSAYVFTYDGQAWSEGVRLLASDGDAGDEFGTSVAVSGEMIVVGAAWCDSSGFSAGAAYVFRYDGTAWIEEAKLVPSDAYWEERFGSAVGLWGDFILVGARVDRDGKGSVYVFHRVGSEWVEEAKIYPDTVNIGDFGSSIAVDAGRALVGAPDTHEWPYDPGPGRAFVYRCDGSQWTLESELIRADIQPHDSFGGSVAIIGDTALVGASPSSAYMTGGGFACVFAYDGSEWVEEAKLLSSDLAQDDGIGTAVALAGDQALVGAAGDDDQGSESGSVYVFHAGLVGEDCNGNLIADSCELTNGLAEDCQYNGIPDECDIDFGTSEDVNNDGIPDECAASCEPCDPLQVLASDGSDGDYFGSSVGISGHAAIAGAPGDDDLGDYSGSAYIFRLDDSEWIEEAKLLASNGAADDRFGCAAGISGDLAVVGARDHDGNGVDSGLAYVFRYDGAAWHEETALAASDGGDGDRFGWSVAIWGDLIVVGAPYYRNLWDWETGCAYVYRYQAGALGGRGSWVEEATLLASDGDLGDFFGGAVAIDQNTIIVGAEDDSDGSAYIFRHDGSEWIEEVKLMPPDDTSYDFGDAVGISGDAVVVGDRLGGVHHGGAAYFHRFDGSDWILEAIFTMDSQEAGFGECVAICGDTAVVGADEWSHSAKFYRFDGQAWTELDYSYGAGSAAAIDGDVAFVGLVGSIGAGYFFSGMEGVDCNVNGVADGCDIFNGTSDDLNNNGIPDECEECPEDLNSDGVVNIDDLFQVLSAWGTCDDCPEDLDDSGMVDIDDIFAVLAAWGPC